MKAIRVIPIAAALVLATGLLGAVPAGAATATSAATSENWAGYAAAPNSAAGFSSVSGSWVQPAAKCTTGASYAAFWVGLGGSSDTSQSLEQDGTQADCNASGQASYYAWYELVPAAPVKLPMAVRPGDRMSGRVSVNGDSVTVSVSDLTSRVTDTRVLSMTAPDTSSAEWIAEAPSACDATETSCQALPLSDFGSVRFTSATATADGHTAPVGDWTAQAVALSPAAGAGEYGGGLPGGGVAGGSPTSSTAGASPTTLSDGGASFSVTYEANATTSTQSTGYGSPGGDPYGYGGGYGYGGYGYGGSGYGSPGIYGQGGYGYSGLASAIAQSLSAAGI